MLQTVKFQKIDLEIKDQGRELCVKTSSINVNKSAKTGDYRSSLFFPVAYLLCSRTLEYIYARYRQDLTKQHSNSQPIVFAALYRIRSPQ